MTHPIDDIDQTFRELVERIAERLRPVCTHMSEEEFRGLVEQMARIEQKYIHHPNVVPGKLVDRGGNWTSPPSGDRDE